MNITPKTIFFYLLLFIVLDSPIFGQLFLQDDFQYKNDIDWYWRSDGNQFKPAVQNGLLHLNLINASNSEHCNTEIYNLTTPYGPGTQVRVRIKASKIHNGSRGWGFWDGSLSSVAFDYDVAWVMQQGSTKPENVYNWFYFGSNSDTLHYTQLFDLNGQVDETKWQTYKIFWDNESVRFYLNDILTYVTNKRIPDQNMRMDIWIDNNVVNFNYPIERYNSIVDKSEMFVDFVELSGSDGPSISRETEGNILIWDTPNSFPNGERNHLWKQYEFNLQNDTETLIFLTGSAESYNEIDIADELKIIVDNNDYGWNNDYSLNGDTLNGKGKSIVLSTDLTKGNHKIDVYSNTTPFLRDVIVISKEGGKTLFAENYNETTKVEPGLWKSIDFNITELNDFTLIVSGTSEQNQEVRFEIDDKDYGWGTQNSINGNELNGKPNTIVINDILEVGLHQLRIYNNGAAQIYSIAAYVSPKLTSIEKTEIPRGDIILRVSPNPFNSSTIINYRTNKPSHNKIIIYNTLGQRVETLISKFQQAGEYNLSWNGNGQTSGIYICILESDNYFRVEKLLLLK